MGKEILSPDEERLISKVGQVRGVSRPSKTVYIGSSNEWEIKAEINAAYELHELMDADLLSGLLKSAKESLGYEEGGEAKIWEETAIGLLRQKWGPDAENISTIRNLSRSISITAGAFDELSVDGSRLERDRGHINLVEGGEYKLKAVCPASGLVKQWAKTAREAFAKLEQQ